MRIGVVSDTHGYFDPQLRKAFEGVEEIWHAGDFGTAEVLAQLEAIAPVRGVYGNIDGSPLRHSLPETNVFEVAGIKVLMRHIVGAMGRYDAPTRALLLEHKPNLLVCGHSHICKVAFDAKFNTLYMNPGAAGMHGSQVVRTALRFEILEGEPLQLEVVELGPRARKLS